MKSAVAFALAVFFMGCTSSSARADHSSHGDSSFQAPLPCKKHSLETQRAVIGLHLNGQADEALCKTSRPMYFIRSAQFAAKHAPCTGLFTPEQVTKALVCLIYAESHFGQASSNLMQLSGGHSKEISTATKLIKGAGLSGKVSVNVVAGANLYCGARKVSRDSALGQFPSLKDGKFNKCF
jgi:hypothetical protein